MTAMDVQHLPWLMFPAFFVSVFVFYWSLAFTIITYRVKIFQLQGKRRDMYNW